MHLNIIEICIIRTYIIYGKKSSFIIWSQVPQQPGEGAQFGLTNRQNFQSSFPSCFLYFECLLLVHLLEA